MINIKRNSLKNGRRLAPVNLPKANPNEPLVDVSMLDFMGIEEFLHILKSRTEHNSKELWKETCTLAVQLKASRELLSIGSNIFSNKSSNKILDRLVESTHIILGAERVYIMEMVPGSNELEVTHSRDDAVIGMRLPISDGIEGCLVVLEIMLR